MNDTLARLKGRLAEIADLGGAAALLGWDQHTYMPRGGIEARVRQMTTLQALIHERSSDPRLGEDLAALEARAGELADVDRRLLRVVRRDYDQSVKLPAELVRRKADATGRAMDAWMQAKPAGDFAAYRPHLETVFGIVREEAEALGYEDQPYDALLGLYEPGMATRRVQELFGRVKEVLVPFCREIFERSDEVDDSFLYRSFAPDAQWELGLRVLRSMGYDFEHGRQDRSPHPFTTGFGIPDVRITTRVHEHDFRAALFGSIHEGGHALYEQNIDPAFDRGPLATGTSLGIHESQSRLWENLVGRSLPFWNRWFPDVKELFPVALESVGFQAFYRAINRVKPSLVRVEADEVTYSLHVFIRFELELELLSGALKVADLPEAWDAKVEAYLGIRPPSPTEGCLQDMHWADASVGYFPTYALGNLYGVQIFNQVRQELPDLDERLSTGDCAPLKDWLTERVYRPGRSLDPGELIVAVTGEPLSPEPFLAYVKAKYGEIYDL